MKFVRANGKTIMECLENVINVKSTKEQFNKFILTFNECAFNFKYRDALDKNCKLCKFYLDVEIEDLDGFDEDLGDKLKQQPSEYLQLFEDAATEIAGKDIQINISSIAKVLDICELKPQMISKIVKIRGIVVSTSVDTKSKATKITIQCRSCNTISGVSVEPGLGGFSLPKKCTAGRTKCAREPFSILYDECKCVDFQIIKLQEVSDSVPLGAIPRHMQLFVERSLCNIVVPGNRVTVHGIYSLKTTKNVIGEPYIRVIGINIDAGIASISKFENITTDEKILFHQLANMPNIYDILAKSIAPSIYGLDDIKKAIICLLFGGSRKILPDGTIRRGDINVMLLGDPGTAKSQLLKFVEKVSPIGVFTSGKGSSAVGLTASVVKDPHSRNFILEGGAMVIADGGTVCIDEFDKMKEDDRVAIHEAMEQGTISVAKAGIIATVNSRCAVFAAANPTYGSWDNTKGAQNIGFMPTILSRFDMIFIIKDNVNLAHDTALVSHIMNVHINNKSFHDVLPMNLLTKYIHYCRTHCGPRMNLESIRRVGDNYVLMRSNLKELQKNSQVAIPITVRQLESIIRIAESIAKLQLNNFVTEAHIDEALRLFRLSTIDAVNTSKSTEDVSTTIMHDTLANIKRQLKQRFIIGTSHTEIIVIHTLVDNLHHKREDVDAVIKQMLLSGELIHTNQQKYLKRIK